MCTTVMPSGIGSTSDGSESVKRSPPTEKRRSCPMSMLRMGGPRRGKGPAERGCGNGKEEGGGPPPAVHGRPQQLRPLRHLAEGVALGDRVARHDDGTLGAHEEI